MDLQKILSGMERMSRLIFYSFPVQEVGGIR